MPPLLNATAVVAPAVDQMLACATSNGTPSIPVASAGQTTVQGI